RPIALARDAFDQGLDIAVEPDRDAALEDQRAGLGIDEGTAAGGDDLAGPRPPLLDQPRDPPPLARTEECFAVARKDFRDRHLRGLLDRLVGVDEGVAERGG